ncbi:hypothetical protein GBAR_LOCUS19617 [Geodia barretti]|uniref:Uncharacterized protein n=1 Tax=Geodia barretti TaxID=519541 RepID=A0AA35SRI4_GEOBA|nr:hypothetical protein GBAR_LOCUS19617 [Geodia barretti]
MSSLTDPPSPSSPSSRMASLLPSGSVQTSAPPTNPATSADSSSSPSSTHLSSPPTRMTETSRLQRWTQKVRSRFSSSSSTTPSHQHLSAPPSRMVPQLVSSSRMGERDTARIGGLLLTLFLSLT